MNIQKIYKAVEADKMNSAIGSIVSALEKQEYKVVIEGVEANSNEILNGKQEYFDNLHTVKLELFRNEELEQSFIVEFTDYHEFVIKA